MTEPLHPAATHHLPPFVTAPAETDVLFVAMAIFVLLAVIGIDTVGLVHAMILRIQALLLPIQTLVFGGH